MSVWRQCNLNLKLLLLFFSHMTVCSGGDVPVVVVVVQKQMHCFNWPFSVSIVCFITGGDRLCWMSTTRFYSSWKRQQDKKNICDLHGMLMKYVLTAHVWNWIFFFFWSLKSQPWQVNECIGRWRWSNTEWTLIRDWLSIVLSCKCVLSTTLALYWTGFPPA